MAGSGPIQYSDLFNQDVQAKLAELNSMANVLDYSFQELAKSIVGMSGRINVSIKGNAAVLNDLDASVSRVDVATKGASDTLVKYSKDLENTAKQTKHLTDQQVIVEKLFDASTASVDELKAKVSQLTKEYNSLDRAEKSNIDQMKRIATEAKSVRDQIDGVALTFTKASKAIAVAEGSYLQASNRLNDLRKSLKELPNAINATTGEWNKANPAVEGYLKEIQHLDAGIKKFDAQMGQHQRNVGNYAGAYNPLSNSITQISRELPTLAQSFQMFTMAIGNNVGPLQDAIGGINAKNKELISQGKPVTSVFSQIASSLFSFTTLLNVGVTLLIVFGKEIGDFIASLFKTKKALNEFLEIRKALQETRLKGSQDAQRELAELGTLFRATQNHALALTERKKAVDLLQEQYPKYFKNLSDEEILAGKVGKAYDSLRESILATAIVRAQEDKIAENASKRLENDTNIRIKDRAIVRLTKEKDSVSPDVLAGNLGGVGVGKQTQINIEEEINKKIKERDGLKKSNIILDKQSLFLATEIDKLVQKNGVDPVIGTPDDGPIEKQKDALELLREKIDAITLGLKLQALAAIQAGKALSFDPKVIDQLDKLQKQLEFAERLGRPEDIKLTGKSIGAIQQQRPLEANSTKIDRSVFDAAKAEAPLLEFGKLLDKYAEAEKQGQKDITEVYSEEIQKRLKLQDEAKAAFRSAIDELKKSGEVIGQIFGSEFGNLFDELATGLEDFVVNGKVSLEDFANFAIAGVRSIDEAYRQGTDARINSLELEKQAQIDIAGTNKEARLNIEKTYNDKIRAEKQKQARIDKTAAIFEIAINTAVAASKVLGQTGLFGIPLLPLVIGLGLAQLAVVIARPIPQFATGRENGPATLAEVNEQGAELLEYKGRYRIANSGKRGVTYLRENERVLTAPVTKKMLEIQEIDRTTELHGKLAVNLHDNRRNDQIQTMAAAFHASRISEEAIGVAVGKEVAKLPFGETTFDERGVTKFIRTQNTTTRILNERYSLK